MTLRDRVPVEDLAPETWRHLEQRVVAHVADAAAAPAPRRWWPALAAVAAAGAIAAVVIATRPAAPTPPRPLVVAADSRGAHVELGDAVIDAEPGTRFEVTRPDGGVRIALASGAVALEVAPRRGRPPLWVVADDVTVRVVGTAFTVRRDPTVQVAVSHGVVQVERAGALVAVRAGERWSSDAGVIAAAPPAPTAAAAAGAADPRGTLDGAASADTRLAGGPAIDFDPLTGRRRAGAPPAGAGTRPSPGAGTAPRDHGGSTKPPTTPPPADPVTDLRRALAAQPIPPGPPTTARGAEAIAELQRASVTERGPAAATALWGLARAQWTAGRGGDALRSLDGYLRRFPGGAESDAVSWLRLRLLCTRDLDDACRAAAHTYATRTDDATRRALAVRVTETR